MDNKKKALLITGSIGTCGLVFLGYKLYRFGFDAGVKYVGEKLFNGELTVEEEDENGKVASKVVDPILRTPDGTKFDEYEFVGVVHR